MRPWELPKHIDTVIQQSHAKAWRSWSHHLACLMKFLRFHATRRSNSFLSIFPKCSVPPGIGGPHKDTSGKTHDKFTNLISTLQEFAVKKRSTWKKYVFHFHKNTNNTFVDINLFKIIVWHWWWLPVNEFTSSTINTNRRISCSDINKRKNNKKQVGLFFWQNTQFCLVWCFIALSAVFSFVLVISSETQSQPGQKGFKGFCFCQLEICSNIAVVYVFASWKFWYSWELKGDWKDLSSL